MAKKQIKEYYEAAISDRIAQYALSRERAISRASELGMCLRCARFVHALS
jgi:hypothetical protein